MNHRINERTRDLTPRAAERALPKADEGARPSSTLAATGRGGRARRQPPAGVAQPAPGRGTCTSPRGHGHAPPSPAPPRSAAHARTRPAAGRRPSPPADAHPRARCPSRKRPLGGARLPPRAPTGGASPPSAILLPPPGARLLPEGRGGRRGQNTTMAEGGRRESERPRRSVRARARARAPGSRCLSRLPARAQPRCRAPPAWPHLITTAPGVRWPRADSAAIGRAGSAARHDWLGGGASAGAGSGPWREAGREAAGAGPGRGPRLCAQRALSVRSGCINNSERQRRRQRPVRAGGGGSSGDRAAAAMHPSAAGQPRHP